ncbi:MAG: ribonuclease HII [Candidatus Komeilibacteria bacterium]
MNKKNIIAGVDEAGRGAWAGPLVAAAVILKNFSRRQELRDSKKLTDKQRRCLYKDIKKECVYSIGRATTKEIFKLGLQAANILAAQRALDGLTTKPDKVCLDMIRGFHYHIPFELIIDGDDKEACIQAASIVAKVTRDNALIRLSKRFPAYLWEENKGYGTAAHRQALLRHGISQQHRIKYKPIREILDSNQR